MYNEKQRITVMDTGMTAMIKIADGNPGACTVIAEAVKANPECDPDCAFAELGPVFAFDSHGIYGSEIWVFYKDVCKKNIVTLLGLMRAEQLGFTSNANKVTKEEIPVLLKKVKERLPEFACGKYEAQFNEAIKDEQAS